MSSFNYGDRADEIQGGTDGSIIGNEGDRLKNRSQKEVLDVMRVIYTNVHLSDPQGSEEMNVDGSVTPVKFNYAPQAGETVYIERINIFLISEGVMRHDNFGALAKLSGEGFSVYISTNGNPANRVFRIRDNAELANELIEAPLTTPTTSGFLNTIDGYRGSLPFAQPMVLEGDLSDEIYINVQHNLSSITRLKTSIIFYEGA